MSQRLFNRSFTFLILGQISSLMGNYTLKFALSMYVLEQTGSATVFATLLSAAMLPTILLSPFGGILADRVTAVDGEGREVSFPADTVVMAAGMRPDQDEVDRLMALVPESYVVGDAFRARQIGQATRDGYDAVINMGL